MKNLIIYKSYTGFTKRYSEWISEELNSEIISFKKLKLKDIDNYDCIIYGGSLHASGISGFKKLKQKLLSSKKNIVLFCVGASNPNRKKLEEIFNKNIEKNENIEFFYFRGGFNFNKLNFFNKIIMLIFKKVLSSKKDKTKDEKDMLLAYEKPVDFSDKKQINDLIQYVRKLNLKN